MRMIEIFCQLLVKKAFFALVYNGVRAAPLWDSVKQRYCFFIWLVLSDSLLMILINTTKLAVLKLDNNPIQVKILIT